MPDVEFKPVPCHDACQNHYGIHLDHRNQTPQKSQWTIDEPAEIDSFCLACQSGWLVNTQGWGLHVAGAGSGPDYLGLNDAGNMQLFVARFVDGNSNGQWHGYPMDHIRRPQDRPPDTVKDSWIAGGYLPAAKVRKIAKGQPCAL